MRRLAAVLLLPILLAACAERPADDGPPAAPAYGAVTLAGDSITLASLRGAPVVLNVWATWCPPCREEMPSLQRLHQALSPRGLRVVAVSIDSEDAAGAVQAFVRDHGIGFTILHDPQDRISRVFRTIGVPETFLIDAEGRLVRRWRGAVDADSEGFRQAVLDVF